MHNQDTKRTTVELLNDKDFFDSIEQKIIQQDNDIANMTAQHDEDEEPSENEISQQVFPVYKCLEKEPKQ